MSQRQAIEARLALYGELSGILGALRSFALAELHRIVKREEAQQQVVAVMDQAWQALAPFQSQPETPQRHNTVWLLLGSTHGFCGSFNEEVRDVWQENVAPEDSSIVVGNRLASLLSGKDKIIAVEGADNGLGAAACIDRILAALEGHLTADTHLLLCAHEEHAVAIRPLLPLPVAANNSNAWPPLLHEPPAAVAAGVAQQYLLHALLAALLKSVRLENRRRLQQMENALHHIEENNDILGRQRNRLRQEEIVAEIEIMAGLRMSPVATRS